MPVPPERLAIVYDSVSRFYRADNATGSKSQQPLAWFERLLG